jgi:acetolactate synthase-1/2/3 large subunit
MHGGGPAVYKHRCLDAHMTDSLTLSADTPLAEAVIEVLKFEGTQVLSCYPTTPLIDASAKRGLRPVVCRQERVGVGIADGYSRTTNGAPAGVFAMQWGPGVENAFPGIATAFSDSSPVLFLPIGYEERDLDDPRFFTAARLGSVAKSIQRIRSADAVGDVMRRAFSALRNGRGGPVIVEIPRSLASAPIGENGVRGYVGATGTRSAGDPLAITTAARMLLQSRRPVIVAGQGVLYAQASQALLELAELTGVPVVVTLDGKSAFPENHPLFLGCGGASMPVPAREGLRDADLVLGIGVSFARHPLHVPPPTNEQTVVHITNDERDINRHCHADCPILGDAQLILTALLAEMQDLHADLPDRTGRRDEILDSRQRWLAEWAPRLRSGERPIGHYRVVDALTRVLEPRQSIVTHDSGSPREQIVPFYPAGQPRSYLGWGRSHALGTGLGLIMGAKLAAPDKVCVNVMGDAAFGMVGLDFETAVRERIPIVTVVLNNSSMATESHALRVSHDRYGTRNIGGRYADLATAMGGWSVRIDEPDNLEAGLTSAIKVADEGSAALVEIVTSPEMTPFTGR